MDWTAFGLSRDPFQRSPELDDACLPNTIAALLSELQSGLRSPQGVSVLVAGGGSGKSIAAAAFARRLGAAAQVAVLSRPTSSVSAIARDALATLDASDLDFTIDDDWVGALRSSISRRAKLGRATAIIIDDAHRLSPQTLEDLTELFGEGDTLRLHIFLFGRPRLLDRMHAGAERALHAHLLQICRLEPLGLRESVRYLERRLAMCGGELAGLYTADAIDEIVQKAEGRLIRLEEVAARALRRATGKGAARVSAEDVMAIPVQGSAEEEEVMAGHQQPLQFSLTDEAPDDAADRWGDEEEDETAVEWGDDDDDDDEEWEAEETAEADVEEPALSWGSSPHHLGDDDPVATVRAFAASREKAQATVRRRLVGPAVLSIGACLALVWAANHVPGPSSDARHGRDAMMFAQPLSAEPQQIMRLATTVEAADADAQVVLWRAQPPRPVEARSDSSAAPVASQAVAEAAAPQGSARGGDRQPQHAATHAVAMADADVMGPQPMAVSNAAAPAASASRASGQEQFARTVESSRGTRQAVASATTTGKSPTVRAAGGKRGAEPVYTVQLGAFKTRHNAEDMVARLRAKSTRILQEGGLYRVMSGSFTSKRDAALHEASLKRAGYTTYVRTAVF